MTSSNSGPGSGSTSTATVESPQPTIPAHTGSKATRRLGVAAIALLAALLVFGLYISGPDTNQLDAARLMYLHLPTIGVTYLAFFITLVGSVIYLRKGSLFWDLLAGASAELGVLFCAFLLITGSLWGKPTWGVYWVWEARLTSTTVMFVMYIGYLAVRRLELPTEIRSRRAAVLGIVSFLNVIVVHYSVQWWRGVHQGQTLGLDSKIEGMMLFSLFVGFVAFLVTFAWLLMHRFRVAWLSRQIDELGLVKALAERRAETDATGLLGRKS